MTQKTVEVPEIIGEVVAATAAKLAAVPDTLIPNVYYMWGHALEMLKRLQVMANSPNAKKERFPLVMLFTDIPITRNRPIGFYGNARMNLMIAHWTEQNLTAPQRLEKTFKPILRPIKEELLVQLYRHKAFSYPAEVEYTEVDRYFYGQQGLYGNDKNIFNDYIDCIDLQNVQVNIKNNICLSKKNF